VQLLGPLQVAAVKYGTATAIPNNDISLKMALSILPSLKKMLSSVGGVYYSPKNVFRDPDYDFGFDISVENNASLLAGLKMLRYILEQKQIHLDQLALINNLIDSIVSFIKASYDPSVGFFRQGGRMTSNGFVWNTGSGAFAVDCQTWVMSVVSPLLIDQWFGPQTSAKVWNTTKQLGGYKYNLASGWADGVGFSHNENDQVFSGEWSLGAVNMLRIFANEYSQPAFASEAQYMRDRVNAELSQTQIINGVPAQGILYANRRYFIPFGWWANPLLSLASTGWAVLMDSNYNPFYFGGLFKVNY